MSLAASSQNSFCGSRPSTSTTSVSGSIRGGGTPGKDPNDVKKDMKEAQRRAKEKLQMLQSELRGAAANTPARYAQWPIGCPVKVACDDPANAGRGTTASMEPDGIIAILVSYDKAANSFEVMLADGSTRIVSAQQVTRARARDRARAPTNLVGKSPHSPAPDAGQNVQSKEHSTSSSTVQAATVGGMQGAVGQAQPLHSRTVERPPFDCERSHAMPQPQMLGREHMSDQFIEPQRSAFFPSEPQPSMFGQPDSFLT
jgi:hypothetical protein